jgi:glutamyl-Q tRNA(Asp) synthetase
LTTRPEPIPYTGRFAPTPSGPLHAGSLVAALASWLDARAHGGRWLVRIEDVDGPRCVPGAAEVILQQLARCGLVPDEAPWVQSTRGAAYGRALGRLRAQGLAYDCGCTRREVSEAVAQAGAAVARHGELVYPGTCRGGLAGKPARAVRLLTQRPSPQQGHARGPINDPAAAAGIPNELACEGLHWRDRRLGPQQQNISKEVGDFVLQRADGLWAYQLAVVVDDAEQGVTHVVRGQDLAHNTPRQILLQRDLGWPTPQYLHTPLVLAADGQKLSKQNGATALSLETDAAVLRELSAAAAVLGLQAAPVLAQQGSSGQLSDWLAAAVRAWAGIIAPGSNHSQPSPP